MSRSVRLTRAASMILALTATFGLLTACPIPEREPLPDWSDGFDGVDTSDTSDTSDTADTSDTSVPEDPMALYAVDDYGILSRLHKTGTTEPCEIFIDGTMQGYELIDCTLDTPELDLYGYGLDFDFVTPFGGCDFVVYHHYMYEAWEVGVGPTEVSYEIDIDGIISNEVNSLNGEPLCAYDYSRFDEDAPNCCLGNYTLSIYTPASELPRVTGPTTWGGNAATCYSGAAYIDPEASFSASGWPTGKIVFVDQGRFEKRFHWDELSTDFVSNVPLANYYDPANHGGGMPAGLAAPFARPYYTFECYDHAEEILGRIRLTVKEWNTLAEYLINGDPHVTGTEPVSGEPLDDRADWSVATPGTDVWIQHAE